MFKIGDVVRLKSGGHNMTVSSAEPDDWVFVYWCCGDGGINNDFFSPEMLEFASDVNDFYTADDLTDEEPTRVYEQIAADE